MAYAAPCSETLSSSTVTPPGLAKLVVTNVPTKVWNNKHSYNRYAPDAFIGVELSLVPEVQSVFVELAHKRPAIAVITVVNDRDPETRMRVYAREQSIIDAFPNLDFTFRIIARMGRNLSEVIDPAGKLVYQR